MSLYFTCKDKTIHICSYTSIPRLRYILTRITKIYSESLVDASLDVDRDTKVSYHISEMLNGTPFLTYTLLNYEYIYKHLREIENDLSEINCEGLLPFVLHCEYEGYHSIYEIIKIQKWFETIMKNDNPEIRRILQKYNYLSQPQPQPQPRLLLYSQFYLTDIFEYAMREKHIIEYETG